MSIILPNLYHSFICPVPSQVPDPGFRIPDSLFSINIRYLTSWRLPRLSLSVSTELIEGNGYEGRQTSEVLNNRRSYNLKVPIT